MSVFLPYLCFKVMAVMVYAYQYPWDWKLVVFNFLMSLPFAFFLLLDKWRNGRYFFLFIMDAFLPLVTIPLLLLWKMLNWLLAMAYKNISLDDKFFNQSFEDYADQLEAKILKESENQNSGRREKIYQDFVDLSPYANILQGNDTKLKINAIEKLSKVRNTEGIRLLKRALNDSTYEVSYFAKGALEEIENAVIRELEAISRELAKNPKSCELRIERGEKSLAFYNLEILDEFTSKIFLEKALYDFSYTLQEQNPPIEAYLRIIEINLYRREYEQVVNYCQFYLGMNDTSENAKTRQNQVKEYLAMALYHSGDQDKFITACWDVTPDSKAFSFWRKTVEAT